MSFDDTTSIGPLAVTMGDPAGIGGDILLAAWAQAKEAALPSFFAIDDPKRLNDLTKLLDLDVPIQTISSPSETSGIFSRALPVLP